MEINGKTGPYNPNTREGYSRNAAYNVMQHDKDVKQSSANNLNDIEFENIQYSSLKGASVDEYIKDAKVYTQESMKTITTKGKVSQSEFIPQNTPEKMKVMLEKFFKGVDLNQDGYIDENESATVVLAMDSINISDDFQNIEMNTPDGYIESKNKKNIDRYIMEFPEKSRALFNKLAVKLNIKSQQTT